MNKLLLKAVTAGVFSLAVSSSAFAAPAAPAAAPAAPTAAVSAPGDESYEKAYTLCSEKAESGDQDYDAVFNACMEEQGFAEESSEGGEVPMEAGAEAGAPAVDDADNPDN